MSPKFHNEFINILANSIKSNIAKKVNGTRQFAVIADTPVHFVSDEEKPEERLLEIHEIVDKTGKGIANEILVTLCANQLDL